MSTWEEFSGRGDPAQRFRIYCRAHDGTLTLVATCGSESAVGVTLCTLGREGEFDDCAVGVLEDGGSWIIRPWEASARNVTDAARTLARSKRKVQPS